MKKYEFKTIPTSDINLSIASIQNYLNSLGQKGYQFKGSCQIKYIAERDSNKVEVLIFQREIEPDSNEEKS